MCSICYDPIDDIAVISEANDINLKMATIDTLMSTRTFTLILRK